MPRWRYWRLLLRVAARRRPHHALEMTAEMALVDEADLRGDLRDRLAAPEQGAGLHDAQLVAIGGGRQADLTFEGPEQMERAEPRQLSQVRKAAMVAEPRVQIGLHRANLVR